MTSIVTGKCLTELSIDNRHCSHFRKEVMGFPTIALAYDEWTNETFTANEFGVCCLWSNRFREDDGDINVFYPYPDNHHADLESDSESVEEED